MTNKQLKTGIGLFYNSPKFDIGLSTVRYFELEETNATEAYNYSVDYTSNFITVLGNYRFNIQNKLTIEPNIMVDFFEDYTDFYPGIFLKFDDFVWAGYNNININDLHSLFLGFDIAKMFRVGYAYDFTKIFNDKSLNVHEFIIGFRLDAI
ncbi:type IX secretion system membrane protein PorP/SprF [Maribellus comscasis]|uniref:Type IX secretion system membrane protein PorP/SprF n=1 Tax=Maribellus comscasis TaxID=2681766 RepID=A0A6I6JNC7_9BACT|nr:type IX secretion system membrane protein PorP/SprF [Maribellus comscasis]QGY43941.1 type IX secretion system membrane protein PorP/SprF [Maribellus comscasis]